MLAHLVTITHVFTPLSVDFYALMFQSDLSYYIPKVKINVETHTCKTWSRIFWNILQLSLHHVLRGKLLQSPNFFEN